LSKHEQTRKVEVCRRIGRSALRESVGFSQGHAHAPYVDRAAARWKSPRAHDRAQRHQIGEAEVIAVGPYVGEIAPGQHVLLRKFSGVGTEIRHEGDTYLLVSIDEILMILLS
jgi:hypothetical protein